MSNLTDCVSKAIVQGPDIFNVRFFHNKGQMSSHVLNFRLCHNQGQRSGDALNGRLRHKPGSKVRSCIEW